MSDDGIGMIVAWLERIEKKLDAMTSSGCAKAEIHSDHEKRIRVLEAALERAKGVGAAINLAAGAVGAAAMALFDRYWNMP